MPSTGLSESANVLNSLAGYMRPTFYPDGGNALTFQHWLATDVTLRAGVNPSTAIIDIPLASQLDEKAPSVVAITGGPMQLIKQGTPCKIEGFATADADTQAITLMQGRVTGMDGNLDDGSAGDRLIVEVADPRYDLEGCVVMGSWWATSSGPAYRQTYPATFNHRGLPNGLWCKVLGFGNVKLFCPPNFGLNDGQQPPDPSNKGNTTKATFFTVVDMCTYFQFTQSAVAFGLVSSVFPFYSFFNTDVIGWAPDWCSIITGDVDALTTGAGNTAQAASALRPASEICCEGMPILAAVQAALALAGPFALYVFPTGGDSTGSTITVVRTRLSNGVKGETLPRPMNGNAADVLSDLRAVTGGNIRESSKNTYTKAAAGGNTVFIERRLYSNIDSADGSSTGLTWGWDATVAANFAADLATIVNNTGGTAVCCARNSDGTVSANVLTGSQEFKTTSGQPTSEAVVRQAAEKYLFNQPYYQRLFASWLIDPAFDYQAGTSESGMPRAPMSRPMLPHLLTSMLQGATAQQGATPTYAQLQAFGQVLFEYNPYGQQAQITNEDYWNMTPKADDFQINADGTFWLRALRDQNLTWYVSPVGYAPAIVLTIKPAAIRATFAIPCDHRVEGGYKIACDATENLAVTPTAANASDAGRIDKTLSRLHYVDARRLYQKWLRKNSYPQPRKAGGSQYPDAPTGLGAGGMGPANALRDDSDYLYTSVRRKLEDVGRVGKGGSLKIPHLNFANEPGQAVTALANSDGTLWPVGAVKKEVHFSAGRDEPQYTELVLE